MQDNKNKYSFSFISMEAHETPSFKIDKKTKRVIFGTDKEYYNRYPDYLLNNLDRSATHNSIVNGKINYITGQGLEVSEYSSAEDLAGAKACIRSINEYESADMLNHKLATDLVSFGGFYIEPVRANDGSIGGYYHIPFQNVRKVVDDNEGFAYYEYTSNWDCRRPEENNDYKIFQKFEGELKQGNDYLMKYGIYRAGDYPYYLPDYLAANAAIETDWRITNFLLNNVKNGFSAGFLINFYDGQPEPEEMKVIERKIKEKFTGDGAGGAFVLNFSHAEAKSAEIIPIPTNGHDERFNTLRQHGQDTIFQSHNVTSPMLFGVRVEGTLGGRNEMIEAFELMQSTYIDGRQKVLEKFWNDAIYFKGINAELEIKRTQPIQERMTSEQRYAVMTQDEIREEAGLKPLETQLSKTTKFASETDQAFIDHFSSCGISNDEFQVIYERGILAGSIEEAMQFAEVTAFENEVLTLINQGLPPYEIANALDTTEERVMEAVNNLEAEGYITLEDGEIKPTEAGVQEDKGEIMTVYKYGLRPDAPPLKGESRPFCRALMSLSGTRSWTIEDISRMNNGQGLDVFTHRGGWYNKPNTNVRIPYCRHRWVQQLVRIRR